ncbi:hypothetical protein [Winogradskyella helgolandensis]|uniref:hypothetical protein n=1 Tax=Winogradskyella helgolandensis TaxID=2697010 RepID=UPI0015BE0B78|nr:hypothetical protein [Winogradskyella helgolandensis]
MKNLIITFALLLITIAILNAQLVIDDFTAGTNEGLIFDESTTTTTTTTTINFVQIGENILGGASQVSSKINQNPYGQNMNLCIQNGLLDMTYAYDTNGSTYVNYSVNKNGLAL